MDQLLYLLIFSEILTEYGYVVVGPDLIQYLTQKIEFSLGVSME